MKFHIVIPETGEHYEISHEPIRGYVLCVNDQPFACLLQGEKQAERYIQIRNKLALNECPDNPPVYTMYEVSVDNPVLWLRNSPSVKRLVRGYHADAITLDEAAKLFKKMEENK